MKILTKTQEYQIKRYAVDRIEENSDLDFTITLVTDLLFYGKLDPYYSELTEQAALCRWDATDLVKMVLEDEFDYHLDPDMYQEIAETILTSLRKVTEQTGDVQECEVVNFLKAIWAWKDKYLN